MTSWPAGYGLKQFDTIDSTNEEARRLAQAGERGPLWIAAGEQTAGRGRRGRSWVSPRGNLSATLLIDPAKPASDCAQLSFAAALAASDAVSVFAPRAEIKVKWPNDVLANGGKISGILLESASSGSANPAWLVIGIGINLQAHPPDAEFAATSLPVLGVTSPPLPEDGLLRLAASFAKWYDIWRTGGFAPIRDAWLARAAGLGTRIRARLQNGESVGVFEGIDANGALLLREAHDRVRTIAAGEVFFG